MAAVASDVRVSNLRLMMEDFEVYARNCLKVVDKNARVVPFVLNRAQRYMHERLEEQLRTRATCEPCCSRDASRAGSTYIQGRFRWKIKHRPNRKAYVVAHEQRASDNLFKIAKRFHDNEPASVRPSTGASNAKELWFNRLDSRYEVATAGTAEIGRSGTAQYFHASEYAFWKNAEGHWAGIGQVVPSGANAAGTEIIVETTANGVNNDFKRRWNPPSLARASTSPSSCRGSGTTATACRCPTTGFAPTRRTNSSSCTS
jgi:hypothetical protein